MLSAVHDHLDEEGETIEGETIEGETIKSRSLRCHVEIPDVEYDPL